MCYCMNPVEPMDMDEFRTKVFVDREKGVVAVSKRLDPMEFINTLAKYKLPVWGVPTNSKMFNKLLMPRRVVAKAKCAEGDKFDFEKGRKIALKKLDDKICDMHTKRLAEFNIWYVENLKEAIRVMDRKGITHVIVGLKGV